MYQKSREFLQVLKKEGYIQSGSDLDKVSNLFLEFISKDQSYFTSSKDPQLLDISLEYICSTGKISGDFRMSLFGLNIKFFSHICILFGYQQSLQIFLPIYQKILPKLKDKFITCGFTFSSGNLERIKIYIDINLEAKKTYKDNIIIVSFTLSNTQILEKKIYTPSEKHIGDISKYKFSKNKIFQKYINYKYSDVLFRYKDGTINSVKYCYSIEEYPEFLSIVKNYFIKRIKKSSFLIDGIKDEIGIDFGVNGDIIKYNYYIGLYK